MAQSSLSESDLLLIIEMCDEGIDRCDAREQKHVEDKNLPGARWDRQVRERYAALRADVMKELEQRRQVIGSKTGSEGASPGSKIDCARS